MFWPILKKNRHYPSDDSASAVLAPAGRFRSDCIFKCSVGDGAELVYSALNRSAQILPSPIVTLLSQCQEFRTLDEHAKVCYRASLKHEHHREHELLTQLARSAPPFIGKAITRLQTANNENSAEMSSAQLQVIRKELEKLVEAGLLVSEADLRKLWESCPPAQQEGNAKCITSVGIITCNRAESLRVCLESYIKNLNKFGRSGDFVIMDDSANPTTRGQNRHVLLALKERYDIEISYAGLEEKLRFAEALISLADLPPEVVNFALFDIERCGDTGGANTNALLLHTVGDMIFSTDDDMQCWLAPAPNLRDGLGFDSGSDFTEFWFFSGSRIGPPVSTSR